MTQPVLRPVCAYDVRGGVPSPVSSDWPEPFSDDDDSYRWIHLDLATPGLEDWLQEHVPETAARALRQKETRPRCEQTPNGLILNLRGVNLNPDASPEDMVSIRLWITERCIITARRRRVFAADAMRQMAENGQAPKTVGSFLAELAYGLAKRLETVTLELEDQTDALEEAVLDGDEIDSGRIGRIRQSAIKMRRYVNPQREALETLALLDDKLLDETARGLIRETANRTRRALEELDSTRDRLAALHDNIDAERALALGRNSYLLSVIAAIFLPLGFLTGLFGVNVAGMPGTDWGFAFWGLTVASVVIGVALYILFKLSRWL